MDRPEDDRFDAWDVALDLEAPDAVPAWLPEVDDGGVRPPAPPEEPRRDPRPGPPFHPHDAEVFSGVPLALALLVMAANAVLVITCLAAGARGGTFVAGVLSAAFVVLFVGPFLVGAAWFGNRRHDR